MLVRPLARRGAASATALRGHVFFHVSPPVAYPGLSGSSSSGRDVKPATTSSDVRILRELSRHLWPDASRPNASMLKVRVVAAVSLLVASKVVNIQVPFIFKALVDSFEVAPTAAALAAVGAAGTGSPAVDAAIVASPLAIVVGYGLARSTAAAAAELRSAIFATVAHDAIRHVSNDVFTHLHALDMQFHLERQTGALARAIDRGSRYVRHPRPRHPIA